MGYIRHHAIVVTSWDSGVASVAHMKAEEIGLKVTAAVESGVNGYVSFMVCPDGSKEGWQASSDGDEKREAFKRWMLGTRYDDGSGPLNWAEVQYGDDNRETLIVDHSDATYEEADGG